jgi:SPP1 gp7 family putative phage head morphogenesis protein
VKAAEVAMRAIDPALSHWGEKVTRRIKEGKRAACPPTDSARVILPEIIQASVQRQLAGATTLQKAGEIFRSVKGQQPTLERHDVEMRMAASILAAMTKAKNDSGIETEAQLKSLADDQNGFWGKYRSALKSAFVKHLGKAVQTGINEVKDGSPLFSSETKRGAGVEFVRDAGVDVSWELLNTNAEQWAQNYAGTLVSQVTDTTKRMIADEVADWIRRGDALDSLKKAIFDILADPVRALVIAQTESTRAFAEGNTRAWKEIGVEGRRWYTVEDERVCPLCGQTLHGTVAAIGKPFAQGIDNPPAHVGCRCYLQPVVEM